MDYNKILTHDEFSGLGILPYRGTNWIDCDEEQFSLNSLKENYVGSIADAIERNLQTSIDPNGGFSVILKDHAPEEIKEFFKWETLYAEAKQSVFSGVNYK